MDVRDTKFGTMYAVFDSHAAQHDATDMTHTHTHTNQQALVEA